MGSQKKRAPSQKDDKDDILSNQSKQPASNLQPNRYVAPMDKDEYDRE